MTPTPDARHGMGPTGLFVVCGLIAAAVCFVLGPGASGDHLMLLLLLLPFTGIPHGALDYALARVLFRQHYGRYWALGFVGLYLLAMALVLVIWAFQPTWSLGAFLALTYYHFSTGDALVTPRTPALLRMSEWVGRGGIILCFPAIFDRDVVQGLLYYLAPEDGVRLLLDALAGLAPVSALAAGICLAGSLGVFFRHRAAIDLARGVEIAVLALIFTVLPALLAFTIHFSFLHSTRHMLGVAARTRGRSALAVWGDMLWISMPVTLATLVLGAGVYGLTSGLSFDAANLTRVIFISIASMTYPHVLVVSLATRAGRDAQSSQPAAARNARVVQSRTMGVWY